MKNVIHLGSRCMVSPNEISRLEAQGNYTLIYFDDGSQLLSSTTLGVLEDRLSPFRFFRVNRSVIINLNYLNRFRIVTPEKAKAQFSRSNSSKDIFLSRRRAAAFMACVNA